MHTDILLIRGLLHTKSCTKIKYGVTWSGKSNNLTMNLFVFFFFHSSQNFFEQCALKWSYFRVLFFIETHQMDILTNITAFIWIALRPLHSRGCTIRNIHWMYSVTTHQYVYRLGFFYTYCGIYISSLVNFITSPHLEPFFVLYFVSNLFSLFCYKPRYCFGSNFWEYIQVQICFLSIVLNSIVVFVLCVFFLNV